jgi:(2Fe-2S) ferredoxin
MSWQAIRIIITTETLDTAVIQCAAVLKVDYKNVRRILEKHIKTTSFEDGKGWYYKFEINDVDYVVGELLNLK